MVTRRHRATPKFADSGSRPLFGLRRRSGRATNEGVNAQTIEPELIFDGRAELAEGPVWHGDALWWVEITAGRLNRLEPDTGLVHTRAFGAPLGAAVPTAEPDQWLLALQGKIDLLDWSTGNRRTVNAIEADRPDNRPNDGKCDRSGRFWIGTMGTAAAPEAGSLYRLDPDGSLERTLEGVTISNGLAWNGANDRFFYIDTPTRRIDLFDFDAATGAIANRRHLREFDPEDGNPDGMAIDSDDNLWVAMWGGGAVLKIDGRTGETLGRVAMPVSKPTSCCFGGPHLDVLYITSAKIGLDPERAASQPGAGSVFACTPGVAGTPVVPARIEIGPVS